MIDIRFDRVSKLYRIPREQSASAPRALWKRIAGLLPQRVDFWALKDLSFEVAAGEALGIIGANGAGKSTVLKILSKITAPTSGEIAIRGRLAALLEVGSGFHPELTGRENVYLSGSILGMRRQEISKKLESIVDFAEVRKFIDVPVKRYSSGMFVRLGFSIAAHLEPDILLLDEVLAVGDAAFQAKCIDRIAELRQAGRTIVFVSHDLGAVQRVCHRVLLLKLGEVAMSGPPNEVIAEYTKAAWVAASAPEGRPGLGAAKKAGVTSLEFCDENGRQTSEFQTGAPMRIRLCYTVRERIPGAAINVHFHALEGQLECEFTTRSSSEPLELTPGHAAIEFHCPELGLQPGVYYVDAGIEEHGEIDPVDWHLRCATIHVVAGRGLMGKFHSPHLWRIVPADAAGSRH